MMRAKQKSNGAASQVIVWSVMVFAGLSATPALAGPLDDLSASLRSFDQRLCRSLSAKSCHHARTRLGKRAAAPKPAPAPPAAMVTTSIQDAAPRSPIPVPQPNPFKQAASAESSDAAAARTPIVVPRPKPVRDGAIAAPAPGAKIKVAAAPGPANVQRGAVEPPAVAPGGIHVAASDTGATCLAALSALHADYALAAAPVADNGACDVQTPVRLLSAATPHGRVIFPEQPLLACRFARQFALWVAATDDITHVAQLWTGPGFQCRGRNGDVSAKLSEHALGDAVDIERIEMADGEVWQVAEAGAPAAPHYRALTELRHSACNYFTTVLGPGTNAAHASHFHVDLALHGRSADYRICE